jgi:hypothetical protein
MYFLKPPFQSASSDAFPTANVAQMPHPECCLACGEQSGLDTMFAASKLTTTWKCSNSHADGVESKISLLDDLSIWTISLCRTCRDSLTGQVYRMQMRAVRAAFVVSTIMIVLGIFGAFWAIPEADAPGWRLAGRSVSSNAPLGILGLVLSFLGLVGICLLGGAVWALVTPPNTREAFKAVARRLLLLVEQRLKSDGVPNLTANLGDSLFDMVKGTQTSVQPTTLPLRIPVPRPQSKAAVKDPKVDWSKAVPWTRLLKVIRIARTAQSAVPLALANDFIGSVQAPDRGAYVAWWKRERAAFNTCIALIGLGLLFSELALACLQHQGTAWFIAALGLCIYGMQAVVFVHEKHKQLKTAVLSAKLDNAVSTFDWGLVAVICVLAASVCIFAWLTFVVMPGHWSERPF